MAFVPHAWQASPVRVRDMVFPHRVQITALSSPLGACLMAILPSFLMISRLRTLPSKDIGFYGMTSSRLSKWDILFRGPEDYVLL